MNIRITDSQEQVIRNRYHTRSQARRMAEENDAWIERFEKKSQESRAQMLEMMELIRTLIRDKGQASGPSPQNETAQLDQKREEPVYPARFTPPSLPHTLRMST